MLAQFERKTLDIIYKKLVDENEKVITLYGAKGIGKTFTIFNFEESLLENWSVIYGQGIGEDAAPYSTWDINHNVKLHKYRTGFTMGVGFIPQILASAINLELEINKTISNDYFFNENEMLLLTEIKKTVKNNKLLIIADDYDQWDLCSQQMIKKMIHKNTNIVGLDIHFLLISSKDLKICESIKMADLSDHDYLEVLSTKYRESIPISKVKKFANNNLNLAFMYMEYVEHKNQLQLHEAIDLIINNNELLRDCGLEKISIINGLFSKKEVSFLLDKKLLDSERLLKQAENYNLIRGDENYYFPDMTIKEYFSLKLKEEKKYLHEKFSKFLLEYFPEDYYNRFLHSFLGSGASSNTLAYEGLQLLLIEYTRRWEKVKDDNGVSNLLDIFDKCSKKVSGYLQSELLLLKNGYIEGFKAFKEYDYQKAVLCLSIETCSISLSMKLDILCMLLLCNIQLGKKINVLKLSLSLYNLVTDPKCEEDELICRSCLILLDVYLDKTEDKDKANEIELLFNNIYVKHADNFIYGDFKASLSRKASLNYPPNIAIEMISFSISHYKGYNRLCDLYMSLCNRAANYIINNSFDEAYIDLSKCTVLLSNTQVYFPSHYKIYNNMSLLSICRAEECYISSNYKEEDIYLLTIQKEFDNLSELITSKKDEVSFVVELNRLALSMILQKDTVENDMQNLYFDIRETDAYYMFYMLNLKFAYAIVNGLSEAEKIFSKMSNISIPLLAPFETIMQQRLKLQNRMLTEGFKGNMLDYHFFFRKNSKTIQDESYYFYMKGLLFSDLQFLSF
ncbi:hypothetical protein [Amedibacillus sp. YH-ame10]